MDSRTDHLSFNEDETMVLPLMGKKESNSLSLSLSACSTGVVLCSFTCTFIFTKRENITQEVNNVVVISSLNMHHPFLKRKDK